MISIIIPLYNKQDCIKRTIYSVIRQDFEDFEIVVVDDGSTDSSGKVVNEIPDERVKYFHKDNQGVSAARNFGLSLAKGEWVLFLDADDVLKEHALSVFKAAVIENPMLKFLFPDILSLWTARNKIVHARWKVAAINH